MEKTKKVKVKKYNLMKKTPAEYVLYSIVFAIFCFFAASYVYMLFWCFYSGTRAPDIVVTDPFGFSKPNFGNYIEVFRIMDANGAGFSVCIQCAKNPVTGKAPYKKYSGKVDWCGWKQILFCRLFLQETRGRGLYLIFR